MEIIQSPSPNHSSSSYDKSVVMIHKTLGLMPYTLEWLQNPEAQVSSQYVITKKGVIHQLVKNEDMAWHAGRVYNPTDRGKKIMLKTDWGSYINPNKYCIGIENEALINDAPTKEQLEANIWLFKQLKEDPNVAFDGSPDHFITHRDTASYKVDLDSWRNAILAGVTDEKEVCDRIVFNSWGEVGFELKGDKIVIFKK
jgi:N-acetyl-anhydromuramyl-L-alanine amidase AmpD